jgi:hypothetical protein
MGGAAITMPLPPPYGRVVDGVVLVGREVSDLHVVDAHAALFTARPTMLARVKPSSISGNSDSTYTSISQRSYDSPREQYTGPQRPRVDLRSVAPGADYSSSASSASRATTKRLAP